MIVSKINEAAAALYAVAPFVAGIQTEEQHAAALEFIEELMDADDVGNPLFNIVADNIKAYEDTVPEYAEFNARIAAIPPGVDAVRLLIDQHNLTLSDLPEIGSKSMVSRVLKGERKLTLESARALAKRFDIPVSLLVG